MEDELELELEDTPGTTNEFFCLPQNFFPFWVKCGFLTTGPLTGITRALRKACLMTGLQTCHRAFAPSRRAQDRERVPVLPHLMALLQCPCRLFAQHVHRRSGIYHDFSLLWLLMEEGAGITHALVGEQNVALSLVLSSKTCFAKSHASLRAHRSCRKVS